MDDGKPPILPPEPGVLDNILSILFPIRCVHCGASGNWLCGGCAAALNPVGRHRCRRCGNPAAGDVPECRECLGLPLKFDNAGAAFVYEGPARSLVHRLKYSGQRRLAGTMADLSCRHADLTGMGKEVTLTYVPQHKSKLLSRGYNQAGIYARSLARRLDLPLSDLLCKQNPTLSQNRLNQDERKVNLQGSIMLRKGARCKSSRVLLVDDVYTTGATASECAGVLHDGLGVDVRVWTFARTVRAGV